MLGGSKMEKKQLSLEENSGLKFSRQLFESYAYLGFSRHVGGLKATRKLAELCHIDKGKCILDVGCGVGITTCYIAKKYGCSVVGIDISERMIAWAKERVKRENIESRVELLVTDAQNLPFNDNLFDVVIGESITTFLEDKQKAVSEYVRVTKPGGYVGLNEETWMKTPPPPELVEYVSRTYGAKPETSDGWVELLKSSGLRDIVWRTYKINVLSDLINEIGRLGLKDFLRVLYRALSLFTNPSYIRSIKGKRRAPKNLLEYLGGYGLYVGRK